MADDLDNGPEADDPGRYRVVISRDGSLWTATSYGRYLPEEGAEATSRTLAGVKEEADRLQAEAYQRALAQEGREFHGASSAVSHVYDLGPDTGTLQSFQTAAHTYRMARGEWASSGHQIASALATEYHATLSEIADIMVVDYAEAALLLTYRARPTRLTSGFGWSRRYRWRHDVAERLAFNAAWRVRQLAVIADDKLREKRASRSVSA